MESNSRITVYQNNSILSDNFREILKINYERCNQLSALNFQIFAICIAIIVGVLSFFGSAYFTSNDPSKYFAIVITIHLLCFTLLFWRYCAHLLDNKIVNCYKKILYCENTLNIPQEISLLSELEKEIEFVLPSKKDSIPLCKKKKFIEQSYENRNLIVQKLIENNKGGYRLQNLLDKAAALMIAVLVILQFVLIIVHIIPVSLIEFESLVIIIPIAYIVGLIGLAYDIPNSIPIQRDPTSEEIDNLIQQIS
jgi:hypothetical protein